MSRIGRGALIAAAFVIAMSELPGTADAVLSGTNGRIAFVSGRGAPNDNTAKLYLRPTIGSTGAGTAAPVPGATGAGQHRHPTWSPDRTMIAYAHGGPSCAAPKCDIFVLDLTTPGASPVNFTETPNVNEDRPAWAPDGKLIAYESEVSAGSGQLDIIVDAPPSEPPYTPVNMTGSPALIESKPAWSPDSVTLYYARGNPSVAPSGPPPVSVNIYKEPASNSGTPTLAVPDSGVHEFQPSISPDGSKICFTLGTGFNTTAAVMVAPLTDPPTGGTVLASEPGGNYNCTWSPDGNRIAYVNGTFSNGDLVMKNSGGGGFMVLEDVAARFDGNPDWAPDGRPQCEDRTIFATVDTPVSIPLRCDDTGPAYERTDVRAFVETEPLNGTVSPGPLDPPVLLPGSVTYTPNAGFTGTDSLKVRSFDQVAFGNRDGTVTVNVQRPGVEPEDGLPPNDFTFGKVNKNKKKGTAKLTVNVPWAGDLELAKSKKLKADERRAGAEGSVKLRVRPKGKTKKKLANTGKAKVKAKVTFTPDGGDPRTKSKRIKLIKRR